MVSQPQLAPELRSSISEKLSHVIPEDGLRKMGWRAECLLSVHKVRFLVSRLPGSTGPEDDESVT